MRSAISIISSSFIPRVVTAGVPIECLLKRDLLGIKWDSVFVNGDSGVVECLLGNFAVEFVRTQIHEHHMIVCPPDTIR